VPTAPTARRSPSAPNRPADLNPTAALHRTRAWLAIVAETADAMPELTPNRRRDGRPPSPCAAEPARAQPSLPLAPQPAARVLRDSPLPSTATAAALTGNGRSGQSRIRCGPAETGSRAAQLRLI